jgi:carbon-monoxide dehydrogenase large subunit
MYIGESVKRREDIRFLTGHGRYVADVKPWNAAYLGLARSPHAHARIVSIDVSRAEKMPGVLAVITGKQWVESGLGMLPCLSPVHFTDGRKMNEAVRTVISVDRVRAVGEIVVAVVAETRYQAMDAAEAVEVTYEPLPSVTSTALALESGAPLVHERFGTNLMFEVEAGNKAATQAAFAEAHHITSLQLTNSRITANSMEPRTYLGEYDAIRDHYTLHSSNQAPHLIRSWLAEETLRVPEHKIRVVAPDVGGGFGMKVVLYPEEPLVLLASKLAGVPVRWTSTRSEGLLTDAHARDHVTTCRMAFDKAGRITGLDVDSIAALGAYVGSWGPSIPGIFYGRMMSGPYLTPAVYVRMRGVYTNTSIVEPYRGASRPEALFVIERLLENGAREMGIDIFDLRERNLIPSDKFPYASPTGMLYDSGDLHGLLRKAKGLMDYDGLRAEQKAMRGSGQELGIGVACFVDFGGGAPNRVVAAFGRRIGSYEVGSVRVHPSGKVTLLAGTLNHGQGHETSYCQIVADRLGIPYDDIELVNGDTDRVPAGLGSWGSRSLTMAGIALTNAADIVIEKCKSLAAHLLECSVGDIGRDGSDFVVAGTDRKLTFQQVTRAAYHGSSLPDDFKLGLEETVFYEPQARNFSSSCHLVVVVVDVATGKITLRDYAAVDDSGRLINPMIVEGQVHGGIVQGIGQALMEECIYDDDSGQLLTGSFMDYAMPRAVDVPFFKSEFQETLAPGNPLGAKGAGESGTIGAPAAVVNAVVDALSGFGVEHVTMPMTSRRVWKTIQEAKQKSLKTGTRS